MSAVGVKDAAILLCSGFVFAVAGIHEGDEYHSFFIF